MKRLMPFILLLCIVLSACDMGTGKARIEKWKQEILDAEKSFAEMAKNEGIGNAFMTYAAEDAVIMRNNSLITGKQAISQYYERISGYPDATLTWEPGFADAAASGDMGYTYGYYTFSYVDTLGNTISNKGVFHTIWKRQPDGTWRFVWD